MKGIKNNLKSKILHNSKLFKLVCFFINSKYFFSNRRSINGKENIINKGKYSIYRNVKIRINGNHNQITIGNRCIMRNVVFEVQGENNSITLNDSINFMEKGRILIQGDNCTIYVGKGSLFREANMFAGESNTKIEIGDNCFCGIVTFSTSDFHSIIDLQNGKRINPPDNIKIGNENWITNYVSIRKGAEIKDYNVISPYTIVNKKFMKSNVILAGQPAKVVKENITWSREKLPY